MSYKMDITIIGVPYDLDELRVGKGLAPETLLHDGLSEQLTGQGHSVALETVTIPSSYAPRETRIGDLAAALAGAVAGARTSRRFPLIIGGDCMVALGAVAGLGQADDTAIAWIDAHGDFNTPAISISGYLGGMPLACAVGRGLDDMRAACDLVPVDERHVAVLGARDLDPLEAEALRESRVTVLSSDALMQGVGALAEARDVLAGAAQLYLHIDIDVLDQAVAPGVDFPTSGGLSVAQLAEIVRGVAGLGKLAAVSLTAVNPEKDVEGRTARAALDVLAAVFAPEAR
jgi:arginase